MEYVMNTFGSLTVGTVLMWLAAIIAILGILYKIIKFIIIKYEDVKQEENILAKIQEELSSIQLQQNDLQDIVYDMVENQREIKEAYENFEIKNREHTLNKLRSQLLQQHGFYANKERNPSLTWTNIEHDVFYNLYQDYVDFGGNGYIHSEIEPDMAKLNVIEMSNKEDFEKLTQSRKG